MATIAKSPTVPAAASDAAGHRSTGGVYGWMTTVDHKRIGILYILTSTIFFVLAGLEAVVMRIQLAQPNSTLV
ncbi:MAG: cytochrome ubiquinol oxidase subunit I, partial [Thermomicrobiales bacterium]